MFLLFSSWRKNFCHQSFFLQFGNHFSIFLRSHISRDFLFLLVIVVVIVVVVVVVVGVVIVVVVVIVVIVVVVVVVGIVIAAAKTLEGKPEQTYPA